MHAARALYMHAFLIGSERKYYLLVTKIGLAIVTQKNANHLCFVLPAKSRTTEIFTHVSCQRFNGGVVIFNPISRQC
jgi:hypothetical protein